MNAIPNISGPHVQRSEGEEILIPSLGVRVVVLRTRRTGARLLIQAPRQHVIFKGEDIALDQRR